MDKFQANLSEHRILLFIVKYKCWSCTFIDLLLNVEF